MTHFPRRLPAPSLGFVVMNLLGLSSPAPAQTPKVEISGGYQVRYNPDKSFPAGWYFDIAGNVSRVFGIVGEAGGAYQTENQEISTGRAVDITTKLHTFMGGVRLNARINPRVVLFHNVLAGAAHASLNTDGVGVTLSASETKFALQPNIGVNLMVTDKIGLRLAADYCRVFLGGGRGDVNQVRFTVGVVLPLGK